MIGLTGTAEAMGPLPTDGLHARRRMNFSLEMFGQRCESALGEITISDEAGECGNRLIGTACSAHLRNSWTNRMHMLSPKIGDEQPACGCHRLHAPYQSWDASGAADRDDRLRVSDPMSEGLQAATGRLRLQLHVL